MLHTRVVRDLRSLGFDKQTSLHQGDSQKIEGPVRATIPDGGIPVADRKVGFGNLNAELKSYSDVPEMRVGKFNLGDVLR